MDGWDVDVDVDVFCFVLGEGRGERGGSAQPCGKVSM